MSNETVKQAFLSAKNRKLNKQDRQDISDSAGGAITLAGIKSVTSDKSPDLPDYLKKTKTPKLVSAKIKIKGIGSSKPKSFSAKFKPSEIGKTMKAKDISKGIQRAGYKGVYGKNAMPRMFASTAMAAFPVMYAGKRISRKIESDLKKGKKITFGHNKTAGGPGSGVSHDNTAPINMKQYGLEVSPLVTIQNRSKVMSWEKPSQKDIKIPLDRIKYVAQKNYVIEKLARFMSDKNGGWTSKSIQVLRVGGEYHLMDGHHRYLAAKRLKKGVIQADIWSMSKSEIDAAISQQDKTASERGEKASLGVVALGAGTSIAAGARETAIKNNILEQLDNIVDFSSLMDHESSQMTPKELKKLMKSEGLKAKVKYGPFAGISSPDGGKVQMSLTKSPLGKVRIPEALHEVGHLMSLRDHGSWDAYQKATDMPLVDARSGIIKKLPDSRGLIRSLVSSPDTHALVLEERKAWDNAKKLLRHLEPAKRPSHMQSELASMSVDNYKDIVKLHKAKKWGKAGAILAGIGLLGYAGNKVMDKRASAPQTSWMDIDSLAKYAESAGVKDPDVSKKLKGAARSGMALVEKGKKITGTTLGVTKDVGQEIARKGVYGGSIGRTASGSILKRQIHDTEPHQAGSKAYNKLVQVGLSPYLY